MGGSCTHHARARAHTHTHTRTHTHTAPIALRVGAPTSAKSLVAVQLTACGIQQCYPTLWEMIKLLTTLMNYQPPRPRRPYPRSWVDAHFGSALLLPSTFSNAPKVKARVDLYTQTVGGGVMP